MHIGIAGPIATRDAAALLDGDTAHLPAGCAGAPLLVTLITELLRRGHRVSAFTVTGGLPLEEGAAVVARGPGLELHYAPCRPRAWPPNGWRPGRIVDLYAFERRHLRRAMLAARPDVVHAHWSYEFAWAALATGLPHLVTCHDSPLLVARFERDFKHGAYRWLRAGMAWHVLRHARCVTTVSPYMVGQVQSLCRAPLKVIPNPISERAFSQPRTPSAEGARVIMVCNGWGARKNPQAGLRAFARLAQDLPQAELHVFGHDFEPEGAARCWWRAQGLVGQVAFRGPVTHAQVLAEMAASDLMLHPAIEESFGAVLAEAMAMALPVVAGAHSGAVPWVVGKAGRLVDVSRPEAMADAMRTLLADRDGMAALGRLGRARALDHFSTGAVVSQYEAEYHAVLVAQATPAQALV